MDANKTEIRTLECKLSVREAAPDAQGVVIVSEMMPLHDITDVLK